MIVDVDVLDNPVWSALSGAQAGMGVVAGRAGRYSGDVAPFAGVADEGDSAAWADLAGLVSPGEVVVVVGVDSVPVGWEVLASLGGVQMVGDGLRGEVHEEAVRLGVGDVPEMLELVERTQPGPFLPRTVELGNYLGIRRGGELVAMAGERMRPGGFTELSAVCTDARYRGQGLAARLIRGVAVGMRERGDGPILHARADNVAAIRLYESIGFSLRRTMSFRSVRLR